MTSAALDLPGYTRPGEHLADHEERVAVLMERMSLLRRALPKGTVQSEAARAEARRKVGTEIRALDARLAEIDARIARRTSYATRLRVDLPLERIRERFALTPLDVEILTAAATFERGSGFNLYNLGPKEDPGVPDVAFYVALLASEPERSPEAVRLRFIADAPLVRGGLLLLSPGPGWGNESPLVYRRVRLAERVTDYLDGLITPPETVLRTWATLTLEPASADELFLDDPSLLGAATRALASTDNMLVLRGPTGSGRKSILGAACRELRRAVLAIDLPSLPTELPDLDRALVALLREARLQHAVLVLAEAHKFGDSEPTAHVIAPLVAKIDASGLPLAITCDRVPAWLYSLDRHDVQLSVPFPSEETQRRLWVRHLPARLRLAPDVSLDRMVKRYSLTGGAIVDAAAELGRLDQILQRGGMIGEAQLADVVRARLSHRLGALASVVTTTLVWDDVILPEEVLEPVFEFLNYAAQRDRVMRDWGFKRKLPYGRGLSALFAGPPGTGKTMICSLLSKELGLELYRIDLSQVVNKYIGETEKNLGRVFDEASRGQVMLLFDEADSIFAKRTEVKSSHDRYANLEVNYLLQRMEAHEGIVVLTTNSETAIDPAFRRRIRFRVRFPAPDAGHREKLWRGMVPREALLADDVEFSELAKKYPLAGGNIMNALVRAATAAAADGSAITQRHLLRAAQLEYSEMGHLA